MQAQTLIFEPPGPASMYECKRVQLTPEPQTLSVEGFGLGFWV